jgi:hypothetical protein
MFSLSLSALTGGPSASALSLHSDGGLAATAAASGSHAAALKGDSVFVPTHEERRCSDNDDNELRIVYVLSWGGSSGSGVEGAGPVDVSPEDGARALLDKAVSEKSSFAMRARAISCVFRLLPAASVDAIFRYPLFACVF